MDELISKKTVLDALAEISREVDDGYGFDYAKWREYFCELPPAEEEQQHGRIFQEIVAEYPSISTYLEYKGKPYFSIKYTENGQEFIGYGTYSPEVLSEYLKEYFMPPAEPKRGKWIQDRSGAYCCSECMEPCAGYVMMKPRDKFCKMCGSRNEVSE